MKLGISTFLYSWSIGIPFFIPEKPMNAFSFIKAATDNGVSLVQIADNLPLHKLSFSEREKLLDYANELDVEIELGTRGLLPDNLHQYLEIAQQFQSPILRIVTDTQGFEPTIKEIKEIIIKFLPDLEAANILLAIENHGRFKSYELVDIIKSVDSPYVGICLDTVNSFEVLEGPETVVKNLGPYTVNLHVKDFKIERIKSNMGFNLIGTPAGEGMLNIPWVLKKLKKYNGNINTILEMWMPPDDTIEKTIKKEQQWVKKSVRNLQKYFS